MSIPVVAGYNGTRIQVWNLQGRYLFSLGFGAAISLGDFEHLAYVVKDLNLDLKEIVWPEWIDFDLANKVSDAGFPVVLFQRHINRLMHLMVRDRAEWFAEFGTDR